MICSFIHSPIAVQPLPLVAEMVCVVSQAGDLSSRDIERPGHAEGRPQIRYDSTQG